jgi:hypothetical protein
MVYDNTKFEAAFDAWLDANVKVGFGEHYAGDLLNDFEQFLEETYMLKRSPGRVVFGHELARRKFESRKRMGLTYWSGLTLLMPPERDALEAKRYSRTKQAEIEEHQKRLDHQAAKDYEQSKEAEDDRLALFKAETESETRDRIEKVGEE